MKRFSYALSLCLVLSVSGAKAMAGDADMCASASDKDICIANLILSKLNTMITLTSSGGDTALKRITYYDESNCSVEWGSGFIPEVITGNSLQLAESSCREISDRMASLSSSNSTIESVKVGTTCTSANISRHDKNATYNDCLGRAGLN